MGLALSPANKGILFHVLTGAGFFGKSGEHQACITSVLRCTITQPKIGPHMRQQLEQRLVALKSEYEKGQTQLRQLESQSSSLRETLLRISGAILVLEELLAAPTRPVSGSQLQAQESTADAELSASARNDRHTLINKEH